MAAGNPATFPGGIMLNEAAAMRLWAFHPGTSPGATGLAATAPARGRPFPSANPPTRPARR